MLINLSEQNSIVSHWMSKIRDVNFQKNRKLFRTYTKQIGEILAYEISKYLDYEAQTIDTPLEATEVFTIKNHPTILSILRAGLVLHEGLLSFFDESDSGFIAAYRKKRVDSNKIGVAFDYSAHPSLDNKTILLCDPMLASGSCLKKVVEYIQANYKPKGLLLATLIASPEGIALIQSLAPIDIWCGTIDRGLNSSKYILPGLGDAGDLSYGVKE